MNKVILMGRLTRDPDIRYTHGDNSLCIASYTLAVDRRYKQNSEQDADFIPCVAFGKSGEFVEKHFRKGIKIGVVGRIQTGSYTNKDGVKVYTTEVVVEEQEFVESKNASGGGQTGGNSQPAGNSNSGNSQPAGNSNSGNSQPAGNSGSRQTEQVPSSLNGFNSVDDDDELPFS